MKHQWSRWPSTLIPISRACSPPAAGIRKSRYYLHPDGATPSFYICISIHLFRIY